MIDIRHKSEIKGCKSQTVPLTMNIINSTNYKLNKETCIPPVALSLVLLI